MGIVFVPNEPIRYVGGAPQTVFDLTPAAKYGEIEILTSGNNLSLSPAPLVAHYKKAMKNFTDDDYIIAIGDPSAMCICCAVAAHMNLGRFKLLKWNRSTESYIIVPVDLSGARNVIG